MAKRKRTVKAAVAQEHAETSELAGSNSARPPDAPAPAKRSRKSAKKAEAEEEAEEEIPVVPKEVRLARVRNTCPKNILERVDRVMHQRFFMIDRRREGDQLREEFKVLGSTGNVYKVIIDNLPSCDCPDAGKGNHCKHILFVFLKVLGVPQHSNLYYQKALLTSELESIFSAAPKNPASVASNRLQELYAVATGESPAKGKGSSEIEGKKRKKFEDGDDCPICYEALMEAKESDLVFCETCTNAVHNECFSRWRRTNAATGKALTCVWCRAPWVDIQPEAGSSHAGAVISKDGYLNLAAAAGVSTARDTSTYYGGPKKGQRYWYSSRYR